MNKYIINVFLLVLIFICCSCHSNKEKVTTLPLKEVLNVDIDNLSYARILSSDLGGKEIYVSDVKLNELYELILRTEVIKNSYELKGNGGYSYYIDFHFSDEIDHKIRYVGNQSIGGSINNTRIYYGINGENEELDSFINSLFNQFELNQQKKLLCVKDIRYNKGDHYLIRHMKDEFDSNSIFNVIDEENEIKKITSLLQSLDIQFTEKLDIDGTDRIIIQYYRNQKQVLNIEFEGRTEIIYNNNYSVINIETLDYIFNNY